MRQLIHALNEYGYGGGGVRFEPEVRAHLKANALEKVETAARAFSRLPEVRRVSVYFWKPRDVLFSIDHSNRKRLDHYGNDGDGWDDEAWYHEYAEPLQKKWSKVAVKVLGKRGMSVEIGEKGHVTVSWQPPKTQVYKRPKK